MGRASLLAAPWLILAACQAEGVTFPTDGAGAAADAQAGADARPAAGADGPDVSTPPDAAPDAAPACAPTTEVCDGVDNDCDGLSDEDLPTLTGEIPSGGSFLFSIQASGSTITACGYVSCGESTCSQCGTLTLGGGVTASGNFSGTLRSVAASGSTLTFCGDIACGESNCPTCSDVTLSHATATGGLQAQGITGLSASGKTITVHGFTSCGESTCYAGGTLSLACAP